MKPMAKTIVELGLVDPGVLEQVRRWGYPVGSAVFGGCGQQVSDADDVVSRLREALESKSQVEVRESDLDLTRQYLREQRAGKLLVKTEGRTAVINVTFYKTVFGEYAMPWGAVQRHMNELLTGAARLRVGGESVPLHGARVVHLGDEPAFVVCSSLENGDV